MSKPTLMGALLNRIKGEREEVRRKITKEIWERNKLGNPQKRKGYKVEENTTVDVEGNSVISVKLWQLVDQENVKISANITQESLELTGMKIKQDGFKLPPEKEPEETNLESLMSQKDLVVDPIKVCETKKYYDTEFEASVAAAKTEGITGEEYEPYLCGNHWHITHTDRSQRRGTGHKYWKCYRCQTIMPKRNRVNHKCDIT